MQSSGLDYTIFRPSFVFGGDGGSLPIYIRQVRWSPVVTVIGDGSGACSRSGSTTSRRTSPSRSRFRKPSTARSSSPVPTSSLRTMLYERIRRVLGKRRRKIHMPYGLVRAGAAVVEKLPGDFPPRATPSRCSSSRTTSPTSGPRSPRSGSSPSASTSNCAEQSPLIVPEKRMGAGSPKITAPAVKVAWITGALGVPTLARRFPATRTPPLPGTTSTARTVCNQDRTTSFPWSFDYSESVRATESSRPRSSGTVTLSSPGSAWRALL